MNIAVFSQFENGKDSLCDYLVDRLNKPAWHRTQPLYPAWYRASFASNVKRIFCETFGVTLEFVEEWKRKDEIPPGFQMPVRQGLIFIGDGFRSIQPNIWIDLLLKNNTKNLIISDGRYINESNYIRSHKGITILLWRLNHENDFPNRSEQEIMQFVNLLKGTPDGLITNKDIPFDVWIRNDGTLHDLYAKIDKIIIPLVKTKW